MCTGTPFEQNSKLLNKKCRWCENEFTPNKSGKAQIYCNENCKREFEKQIRFLGLQLWDILGEMEKEGKKYVTPADILNEFSK